MTEQDGSSHEYMAVGLGSEHFDAPALFYLSHAESIERWAELKHTARSAIALFLDAVVEEFDLPATVAGWNREVSDTARGYHHLLLSPSSTPRADDETPAIAICFGWNGKKVRITPGDYTPFAGVRVGIGAAAPSWRAAFMDAPGGAREIRDRRRYRAGSPEWPAWKQVDARGRWWENLDDYRDKAHRALSESLDDFAGHLERTVAALTPL
jgi:hypothetical protein